MAKKSKKQTKSKTKKTTKKTESVKSSSPKNTTSNLADKLKLSDTPFLQKTLTVSYQTLSYIGIGILALVAIGYYLFNQWFVVATVNGEAINRFQVYQVMEQQGASEVLDILITETLVEQNAKQQDMVVSDTELEEEIQRIEAQYIQSDQSLDDILALQGTNREELNHQIRINLLIEKLVGDSVPEASEEAVLKFYQDNQAVYANLESQEDQLQAAKQDLESQNRRQAYFGWIEQAKAAANVNYQVDW